MAENGTGSDKHFYYGMLAVLGLCVLIIGGMFFMGGKPGAKPPGTPPEGTLPQLAETPGAPASADGTPAAAPAPRTELPVVSTDDTSPQAQVLLAIEQALAADDIPRAEELQRQGAAAYPKDARFTVLKDRITRARTAWRAEADAFMESARRAVENGQWALAADSFENVLARRPDSPEIKAALADARFRTHAAAADRALRDGAYPRAVREADAGLALKPDDDALAQVRSAAAAAITAGAQAGLQKDQFEKVRGDAEDAFGTGRYAEARTLFQAAAEFALNGAQDAYIAERIQQCDERRAAAEATIRFQALAAQADAAQAAGQPAAALELWRQAQALKPGDTAAAARIAALREQLVPPTIEDALGLPMALVPGGPFRRGLDTAEAADFKPAQTVTVSAFYMDVTEITNRQFELFDPGHTRTPVSQADDTPATNVTWAEAAAFCQWRGQQCGGIYRLPTEAEWEKAARGGADLAYSWGIAFDPRLGNAGLATRATVAAASFPPNPFGLFNLSGNVWEWCLDWYAPGYYAVAGAQDPRGPADGKHRVVRGGSFCFAEKAARTYSRNAEDPAKRATDIGFRCVREVPAQFLEGGQP
jgi:formylglycine-generating enzyme required for sulfatase activity